MSDAVDRAARVIADHTGTSPDTQDGFVEHTTLNPGDLARALHEAGLLAPTCQTDGSTDQ